MLRAYFPHKIIRTFLDFIYCKQLNYRMNAIECLYSFHA